MRFDQINEKQSLDGFNTRQALYHGTSAEFSEFDQKFLRSAAHFYTTPDPATAKFYGDTVYLCYGRGQRADLINDTELLLKLAGAFADEFEDDAKEELNAFDDESVPHDQIMMAAKRIAYDTISGGELYNYDLKGYLQNQVLDAVFDMGYESIRMTDYSHTGASVSIVFRNAQDVQIVRKLEDNESQGSHHFDLDESVENPTQTDFHTIVTALKKDPATGPAFKSGTPDLDAAAMLVTMRRLMFNNHDVRKLLDGAVHYKYLLKPGMEPSADSLVYVLKEFAKRASGIKRGALTARAKKELRDYMDSVGGRMKPSQATIDEIMSVPALRPNKPVVLYRGLMFERSSYRPEDSEAKMAPFLKAIRAGKRSLTLPQDKLSSWSYSPAIAERFARYKANYGKMDGMMSFLSRSKEQRHIDGELGVVVQLIARPEDILVDTTMVDLGYNGGGYNEAEVILKPGAKLVRIFVAFNQQGQLDLSGAAADESEADKTIKQVVSAAQMVDIQTTFVKPMWSNSLDWTFERMSYAYEKRSQLVKKAQAVFDSINPVVETLDVRTLDPTTVAPEDMGKLTALKHLAHYMKSMREHEGDAMKFYKEGSQPKGRYGGRGSDGDFFEANRSALYKMAMQLEGKEVHYRDRVPVYYRLKPVNQEALLGKLVDHYIELAGKDRPDTWEARVKMAYDSVKAVRNFNGLASWYSAVMDNLKTLEGHD